MWLRFPEGCDRISVELQQFQAEATDAEGFHYFRVPDHFAPKILQIPGFIQAKDLPEGAPDDLPKADPLRDSAISTLTATVEAQKTEIRTLSEDLSAAMAQIIALKNANDTLGRENDTLKAKIEALEEGEDDPKPAPVVHHGKK